MARTLIRATDLSAIAQIAILATLSWISPERHWASIARRIALVNARVKTGGMKLALARRRHAFDDRFELEILDRMETLFLTHLYLARMQGYREYRLGGWRSEIQVIGADHIDAAIAAGRGVVLWVAQFAYNDLVSKKGLYEAGYRISHLSRPRHNISATRFGITFLNPIWTRIEDRYLAERVLIRDAGDSGSALALLRQRLKENRIISISVGGQAKRFVPVDFLNCELRLGTGPLHLARTSKAVLLPIFTVKQETGILVVNVEPPLIGGVGDDGEEPYESVVQRYAERLRHYVLQYPDQWSAKYFTRPKKARAEAARQTEVNPHFPNELMI